MKNKYIQCISHKKQTLSGNYRNTNGFTIKVADLGGARADVSVSADQNFISFMFFIIILAPPQLREILDPPLNKKLMKMMDSQSMYIFIA